MNSLLFSNPSEAQQDPQGAATALQSFWQASTASTVACSTTGAPLERHWSALMPMPGGREV